MNPAGLIKYIVVRDAIRGIADDELHDRVWICSRREWLPKLAATGDRKPQPDRRRSVTILLVGYRAIPVSGAFIIRIVDVCDLGRWQHRSTCWRSPTRGCVGDTLDY